MLQDRLYLSTGCSRVDSPWAKESLQVRFLPDYKRLLGRLYLSTRGTGIDFIRIKDAPG
jgi:hypothetical protein